MHIFAQLLFMKCKLVKLPQLCGGKAFIYSLYLSKEGLTLFDIFVKENQFSHKDELKDIVKRLNVMAKSTGAKIYYFKTKEGARNDDVCALYDDPKKSLRLYCIRKDNNLIILGGGGPKLVRKLQDDPKLKRENYLLRSLSSEITKRLNAGTIKFGEDGKEIVGDLEFNIEDNE